MKTLRQNATSKDSVNTIVVSPIRSLLHGNNRYKTTLKTDTLNIRHFTFSLWLHYVSIAHAHQRGCLGDSNLEEPKCSYNMRVLGKCPSKPKDTITVSREQHIALRDRPKDGRAGQRSRRKGKELTRQHRVRSRLHRH